MSIYKFILERFQSNVSTFPIIIYCVTFDFCKTYVRFNQSICNVHSFFKLVSNRNKLTIVKSKKVSTHLLHNMSIYNFRLENNQQIRILYSTYDFLKYKLNWNCILYSVLKYIKRYQRYKYLLYRFVVIYTRDVTHCIYIAMENLNDIFKLFEITAIVLFVLQPFLSS